MARRWPTNDERSSKLPPSSVQPRLECSLCHRRRSSRMLDTGLSDFDRLICSRVECSKFKAILETLSSSRPVFQTINFITNNHSNDPAIGGAKDTAAACRSLLDMENRQRTAEKVTQCCQAVELTSESSTVGRAELPEGSLSKDFKTMSYLGSMLDATENPPWVDYSTKPVRR